MYQKSQFLVLHSIKHKDSTRIIYLLQENGNQITVFGGGFGKKKSDKSAVFYPGNIIEGELLTTVKSDLKKIKDPRIVHHYHHIHDDFIKSAILSFVLEVLHKHINSGEAAYNLFPFVENILEYLESHDQHYANIPVILLIEILHYHGIKPESNPGLFNYKKGAFEVKSFPSDCFSEKNSILFNELLNLPVQESLQKEMNAVNRKALLNDLFQFIRYHVDHSREIYSLDILSSLLS